LSLLASALVSSLAKLLFDSAGIEERKLGRRFVPLRKMDLVAGNAEGIPLDCSATAAALRPSAMLGSLPLAMVR